jgi:hypothetical protein
MRATNGAIETPKTRRAREIHGHTLSKTLFPATARACKPLARHFRAAHVCQLHTELRAHHDERTPQTMYPKQNPTNCTPFFISDIVDNPFSFLDTVD